MIYSKEILTKNDVEMTILILSGLLNKSATFQIFRYIDILTFYVLNVLSSCDPTLSHKWIS